MKVLLKGETGTGKTFISLYFSRYFKTVYFDTEKGTELWLEEEFKDLKENKQFKVFDMSTWLGSSVNLVGVDLVVIDSISELMEVYKDFLQNKIRAERKFPLPTATGIVDLDYKGYDPDMIVLPAQVYQLLYDNVINFVTNCIRCAKHVIATLHPIETRQLSFDGKVIESHGRKSFVQSLNRKFDVIISLRNPEEGYLEKSRGKVVKEKKINPIEYLKNLFGVDRDEESS